MQKIVRIVSCVFLLALATSCEKWFSDEDDKVELKGEQSAMGQPGVKFDSWHSIEGVSYISAVVVSLEDGVSVVSGSAKVINPAYRELIKDFPYVQIVGDSVFVKDIKFRMATDGFELLTGDTPGIIAKYDSKVGDTYPMGSEGKVRTVIEKTDENDYPYGFMYIKVMKVEEIAGGELQAKGVEKIHYFANHRFGLVGIQLIASDTIIKFPVYCTAENN